MYKFIKFPACTTDLETVFPKRNTTDILSQNFFLNTLQKQQYCERVMTEKGYHSYTGHPPQKFVLNIYSKGYFLELAH